MPLYDYYCKTCKVEFESITRIDNRKKLKHDKCGKRAKLMIPKRAPGLTLFKPGWWRDLAYEPVYIDSPQTLRNHCDSKNVYANYLENGIWKTSPGQDPTRESAPELFGGNNTIGRESDGDGNS